jgi:glycosyltransferase involved in cell wall biosynthesis
MPSNRRLSSLTVVAPFFNEQDGAPEFHRRVSAELAALPLECNFVFVDDGSTDATLRVLNEIADRDPRVTVIGLSRNWGHQIALTAGIDYAQGEAVIVMDSDLQHPPEAIARMVGEYAKGADVVYGVRRNQPKAGFLKRVMSRWFYRLLRRSTHVQVVGDAADFRLMSQPVVAMLRRMREVHRYLRGMVPWLGFSDAIVYYDEAPRLTGDASYTWRKSFRLANYALFSFSRLPLDAISLAGVLFSGLALLYLVFVLISALSGRTVAGWSSVIAVVLIVSAVQFLSVSILAQYLGMVFEQTKARPLYVLRLERLGTSPVMPQSTTKANP